MLFFITNCYVFQNVCGLISEGNFSFCTLEIYGSALFISFVLYLGDLFDQFSLLVFIIQKFILSL